MSYILSEAESIKLGKCGGPRKALLEGVKRAAKLDANDDKAWAMRDAFDGLLEVIERREKAAGVDGPAKVRRRSIPRHPLALLKGCGADDLKAALLGIARAIALGAPLYNEGNHAACYRSYESAARELSAQAPRCPGVRHALAEGVKRAGKLSANDDKAWALRDAFDGLIQVLERKLFN